MCPPDTSHRQSLHLVSSKGAPLSLLEAEKQFTPPWGLNLGVHGQREFRHIFNLATTGEWIKRWILSPNTANEISVPENAIANSSTETITVFRPSPTGRRAAGKLRFSSHWLITPYASINGFTVGLIFMETLYNGVDNLCVCGAPSGKFAMNDETGELIATTFKEDGSFIVGWIASVASCERVREILEFEAPIPGHFPQCLIKRNSLYERRNCRICGVPASGHVLPPPCSGIPRRRMTDPVTFKNFGFKGFRGSYFGTCSKALFDPFTNRPKKHELVPVFIDLRHSIPAVREKLKLKLRRGLVSFGTAPQISSGLFVSDQLKYLLQAGSEDDPARLLRGRRKRGRCAKRERGKFDTSDHVIEGTLRRRNVDESNRDTIKFLRIQRNREAARKANEAKRLHVQRTKNELEHLKNTVVPKLQAREKELEEENEVLRSRFNRNSVFEHMDFLSFYTDDLLASSSNGTCEDPDEFPINCSTDLGA